MQIFDCHESPVEVHGLPFFKENGRFDRMPEEVCKKAPCAGSMSPCSVGARVCFRTDSPTVWMRMKVKPLSFPAGMSMIAGQSLHGLYGDRKAPMYVGAWTPEPGGTVAQGIPPYRKAPGQEDVTVYLPRNAIVEEIQVGIEDGCKLRAPTPYRYPPLLFYGSSITAGGSCTVPFNAYPAILSHHLDADFYNFGFSGACMGELAVAECIGGIGMSVFVYDYDYNAPDADFLRRTHEPFFLEFRKRQPDTPVVMLSGVNFAGSEEDKERRAAIFATYSRARERGDENVYFIDGATLYGEEDRYACTADGIHPNDFGARRMAERIEPLLKGILEKKYSGK